VIAHTGPVSGLAAESAYYIATSHYLEKDDPAAIQAFQELIRMFPRSSWVPEAQYHIGLSYLRMGQLPQAFAQLRHLIEQYPHTRWAGYATDRLKK
jgi:TolA-binding protein